MVNHDISSRIFFSVYKTGSSLSSLKENAFIVLLIGNDIASVKKHLLALVTSVTEGMFMGLQ